MYLSTSFNKMIFWNNFPRTMSQIPGNKDSKKALARPGLKPLNWTTNSDCPSSFCSSGAVSALSWRKMSPKSPPLIPLLGRISFPAFSNCHQKPGRRRQFFRYFRSRFKYSRTWVKMIVKIRCEYKLQLWEHQGSLSLRRFLEHLEFCLENICRF